jgi:hypothetical protein
MTDEAVEELERRIQMGLRKWVDLHLTCGWRVISRDPLQLRKGFLVKIGDRE